MTADLIKMDRGFFSNLKTQTRPGQIDTDFKDIRSLQIMTDKLKRLVHLLKLNKNLCRRVQGFFECVRSASPPSASRSIYQYEDVMENYFFQNETHTSQLESIMSRAEGVGSLVSDYPNQVRGNSC